MFSAETGIIEKESYEDDSSAVSLNWNEVLLQVFFRKRHKCRKKDKTDECII